MRPKFLLGYLLILTGFGVAGADAQGWVLANRAMHAQPTGEAEFRPIDTIIRSGRLPAALARQVSIQAADVPLEQALEQIGAQAGLQVSYTEEVVKARALVTLDVQNVRAAEALAAAARGTGWMVLAARDGRVIVLPQEPPRVQEGIIRGRVTAAATQQPLSNVAVAVEGTARGAVTDENGHFTITGVPVGRHRVRASQIGYAPAVQSVTVTAGQPATVEFALAAQAVELEGVVAVGYGTQRRRDITGAVGSLTEAELDKVEPPTVAQALQGRVAGVEVTQNSNAPGGGVSIRIRGSGSLNATNEPLYVIDGIPISGAETGDLTGWERTGYMNPIAFLDPDNIESIDVLKDASATAIYGARGTNGVVLITTKQGRSGTSQMEFASSLAIQKRPEPIPVLGPEGYASMVNDRARIQGLPAPFDLNNLPARTDWQDLVLRDAPMQDYSLSLRGGTDRTRFSASGNFTDQQGVVRSSDFQRYGVRANLQHEAKSWLTLGSNINVTRVDASQGLTDAANRLRQNSSVIGNAMGVLPVIPVYRENGEYTWMDIDYPRELDVLGVRGLNYENPVALINEITDRGVQNRVLGSAFAEAKLSDALRLRLSGGGNLANDSRREYWSSRSRRGREAGGGIAETGVVEQAHYLAEAILNYNKGFGALHHLDITTGATYESDSRYREGMSNSNFPNDVTKFYSIGAGNQPGGPKVGSSYADWTLLSYLGRANYTLADKYLFTLTGRADGSSKFGADNKWGFFPSGAFAWRVSEEPFLRDIGLLSDLKLRVSYGLTGNQEIGTYASLARLSGSAYVFGGTQRVPAYYPGSIGNPELRWERSEQFDLGLDAALFDNRVLLTFDLYRKLTDDLLLDVPLPYASGFSSAVQNLGSIENRGVELALDVNVLEGYGSGLGALGWRTNFNLTANRNKVLDVGEVDAIPFRDRAWVIEGEPIGVFYHYKVDGIFRSQAEVDAYVNAEGDPIMPGAVPGELRYADVNGDGKITADDRTIIGDPNPDYSVGWSNDLTLGAFSLYAFLQGTYGNDVFNFNLLQLAGSASGRNNVWAARYYDAWSEDNPDGAWPILDTAPGTGYKGPGGEHDFYIEDGSYLRLRNLTLSFDLPARVADRMAGMQSARIYLNAENLFTWTDYRGLNPDVNANSQNNVSRGIDRGSYPLSRVYRMGVRFGL